VSANPGLPPSLPSYPRRPRPAPMPGAFLFLGALCVAMWAGIGFVVWSIVERLGQ
jgi:hypothetical protein